MLLAKGRGGLVCVWMEREEERGVKKGRIYLAVYEELSRERVFGLVFHLEFLGVLGEGRLVLYCPRWESV